MRRRRSADGEDWEETGWEEEESGQRRAEHVLICSSQEVGTPPRRKERAAPHLPEEEWGEGAPAERGARRQTPFRQQRGAAPASIRRHSQRRVKWRFDERGGSGFNCWSLKTSSSRTPRVMSGIGRWVPSRSQGGYEVVGGGSCHCHVAPPTACAATSLRACRSYRSSRSWCRRPDTELRPDLEVRALISSMVSPSNQILEGQFNSIHVWLALRHKGRLTH